MIRFTPELIVLLAPGRTDPAFLAMAVQMTRIILPAQFFFFAGGLLMAVQFARERFFIPALAPLIYNLGIILGGRLGFVLFYQPGYYLQNPLDIPKIWQGGMAFHGGFLGRVIAHRGLGRAARQTQQAILALGELGTFRH
mgnify:CR=1 FL=1